MPDFYKIEEYRFGRWHWRASAVHFHQALDVRDAMRAGRWRVSAADGSLISARRTGELRHGA